MRTKPEAETIAQGAPRVAGPIHPSPSLRGILAALGALDALDPHHRQRYAPTSHEIDAAQVAEWDRALGFGLPIDVLVLASLMVPILERALGSIEGPLEADDVDDGKWVGVWAADPFAMYDESEHPTYQQTSDLILFLERRATTQDPGLLVVGEDDGDEGQGRPRKTTLSKFLVARLSEHFSSFEGNEELSQADRASAALRKRSWEGARSAPLADAEVANRFSAAIVGQAKPAFAPVRVVHPKLGHGTMVGLFEGKAEVVFDSGVRKTIKREFLEDL